MSIIVHIPAAQQPTTTPFLTVIEYVLNPASLWQIVGIHDGWRPLCVRSLEHSLVLVVLADLSRPIEAEQFRLVLPGDDLEEFQQRDGVELAFIGQTWNGYYLFLGVKPEADEPIRRDGRPSILEKSGEDPCALGHE